MGGDSSISRKEYNYHGEELDRTFKIVNYFCSSCVRGHSEEKENSPPTKALPS